MLWYTLDIRESFPLVVVVHNQDYDINFDDVSITVSDGMIDHNDRIGTVFDRYESTYAILSDVPRWKRMDTNRTCSISRLHVIYCVTEINKRILFDSFRSMT